jgi:transposase
MLSFSPHSEIFLAVDPVDMRKSFDGLAAAVQTVFARSALDGQLFLFFNRRRDRLKLLWWDRDGYAIFAKRLEQGTFELPPHAAEAKQLVLDARQLLLILNGVQLASVQQRRRYVRPAS